MHVILEALLLNLLIVYYILEGIVLFFVPSKRKDVKGQKVLITGAGSGIGRLIALRFANLGCITILWDIDTRGNEETASQIRKIAGAKCFTYTCDISSKDAVYSTAEKVLKEVGDVDILVNNAGIVTGKKLLDSPDSMIEKTLAVNTLAHFWTVKSFLPAMLKRNSGHVVSIASAAGYFGFNGLVDYCCSKFGAVGFDESLQCELEAMNKTRIRTTVVCPYFINTGMFSGVTIRFPSLMPELSPEYAADKVIGAVLTNQQIIFIPKTMYIFAALKNILPIKAMAKLSDFLGNQKSMDTFKGRKKLE